MRTIAALLALLDVIAGLLLVLAAPIIGIGLLALILLSKDATMVIGYAMLALIAWLVFWPNKKPSQTDGTKIV